MTTDDKPMFVASLTQLAVFHPNTKLTAEHYTAWWNTLRHDWSLSDFQQACAQLARECEYMPNPFHFEQLRKRMRPTAGEAWALAREHALALPVSGGYLQERATGDPLLDSAVRAIGGYKAIAGATERDLQFIERRFAEHYADIREAEATRITLPQLRGPQPIAELLGRPQ